MKQTGGAYLQMRLVWEEKDESLKKQVTAKPISVGNLTIVSMITVFRLKQNKYFSKVKCLCKRGSTDEASIYSQRCNDIDNVKDILPTFSRTRGIILLNYIVLLASFKLKNIILFW